jgi:sensor histidine kinase YesM
VVKIPDKYIDFFSLKTILILFVSGGLFITLFFFPLFRNSDMSQVMLSILFNGLLTVGLGIVNGVIAEQVKISWLEQPIKRFIVSFVLTIIATIVVAALVQLLLRYLIFGVPPLEALFRISTEYYYNVLLITLVISTFLHGRSFLLDWRKSIEETEALKRAHLTSQYESLKNQVNPHFLFNSLNVLTALVHKDADLSEKFIRQLSDVYRYVLEVSEEELVHLDKELKALEAYVFLLKIRFGQNLEVDVDVTNTADQLIPPMSLQMLVENAVKHNIISKEQPLKISIIQKADGSIVVENNLQKKNQQPYHLGIGLKNIKKRYQRFLEDDIKIVEKGGCFRVVLPVIRVKQV